VATRFATRRTREVRRFACAGRRVYQLRGPKEPQCLREVADIDQRLASAVYDWDGGLEQDRADLERPQAEDLAEDSEDDKAGDSPCRAVVFSDHGRAPHVSKTVHSGPSGGCLAKPTPGGPSYFEAC